MNVASGLKTPLDAIWFLYFLLYRKRMVASSVTVRLRGSYAEDQGWIPGRFGIFTFLSLARACKSRQKG